MIWDQTIIELFGKGGFVMWPLLFCSVVGFAIILERLVYFSRLRMDYGRFMKKLREYLKNRQFRKASEFCRKQSNPVPRLAATYLHYKDKDALRNNVLQREGSLALEKVEDRLKALAAISHIAPLLGLLGTVVGLVTAFHQIEALSGQVNPSDLAGGIWQALLTTVAGLLVAIPCMAAFHGFENHADYLSRRMQFVISELDEVFGKEFRGFLKASGTAETDEKMKAVQ